METSLEQYIQDVLSESHPVIASIIRQEDRRQASTIELIASENFPSDAVNLRRQAALLPSTARATRLFVSPAIKAATTAAVNMWIVWSSIAAICGSEFSRLAIM